jgi:hypothetical protein
MRGDDSIVAIEIAADHWTVGLRAASLEPRRELSRVPATYVFPSCPLAASSGALHKAVLATDVSSDARERYVHSPDKTA